MWRFAVLVAFVFALIPSGADAVAVAVSFQVRLPGHTSEYLTDPEGLVALGGDSAGLTWRNGVLAVAGDDGTTRVVTQVPTHIVSVVWSPDRRAIAFETYDGCTSPPPCGRFQVWTVRSDGSALTRVRADAAQPAWAPDSRRLAFVDGFDVTTSAGTIATANADGTELRELTPRGPVSSPAWSADAHWVAYSFAAHKGRRSEIRIADPSGRHRARALGRGEIAVWAPRGERIAFVRYRSATGQVLLVRTLAEPRAVVVASAEAINEITWSHTGARLAYAMDHKPVTPLVGIVDRHGRNRTTVVPPRQWRHGDIYSVAWSHEDATLYYAVRSWGMIP